MMWKWGLTSASAHTALRKHQRARRQPGVHAEASVGTIVMAVELTMALRALWVVVTSYGIVGDLPETCDLVADVPLQASVHPQGYVKGLGPAYNSAPCQTRVELYVASW